MKYFIIFILMLTGCSSAQLDYASKDCDINYKGVCYFEKRVSDEEEKEYPRLMFNHKGCKLLTASKGCINPIF